MRVCKCYFKSFVAAAQVHGFAQVNEKGRIKGIRNVP